VRFAYPGYDSLLHRQCRHPQCRHPGEGRDPGQWRSATASNRRPHIPVIPAKAGTHFDSAFRVCVRHQQQDGFQLSLEW